MAIPNISDYNTWDGSVFNHPEIDGNSQKTIDFLTTNYDVTFNSVTASEYVGIPSGQFSTITAGENLSAGDVVRISGGQAYKADNTSEAGVTAVVGVCNTTVSSGQTVKIDYGYYDAFTALTVGTTYYVGVSGGITSTLPTTYQVKLGVAVSTTRINLDITIENDIAGQVAAFARTTVPTGWLECNGQNVSRTTYANLFNSIGVTWGAGDGSSTFTLPDMRDRYPRGKSTSHGVGDYLDQLTKLPTTSFSGTTSNNGNHFHDANDHLYTSDRVDLSDGFTTATKNRYYPQDHANRVAYGSSYGANTSTNGNHSHTTTITGGGDSETRPKTSVLLYCIKY